MKWYDEEEGQPSTMRIMVMLAFIYALIVSGTSVFQTIFAGSSAVSDTWQTVLTFLGFAVTGKIGQRFAEK